MTTSKPTNNHASSTNSTSSADFSTASVTINCSGFIVVFTKQWVVTIDADGNTYRYSTKAGKCERGISQGAGQKGERRDATGAKGRRKAGQADRKTSRKN